jgi:hypothetical protein
MALAQDIRGSPLAVRKIGNAQVHDERPKRVETVGSFGVKVSTGTKLSIVVNSMDLIFETMKVRRSSVIQAIWVLDLQPNEIAVLGVAPVSKRHHYALLPNLTLYGSIDFVTLECNPFLMNGSQ